MNALIEKYTDDRMTFKMSLSGKFISVYIDGRLNGHIWNVDKEICINGDLVNCKDFFA